MITFKTLNDSKLTFFPAWGKGKDTLDVLRTNGDCERIEDYINLTFNDHTPEDVEINDVLWFEKDDIAAFLGYSSWDDYVSKNKNA